MNEVIEFPDLRKVRALEKTLKHGERYCGKSSTISFVRNLSDSEIEKLLNTSDTYLEDFYAQLEAADRETKISIFPVKFIAAFPSGCYGIPEEEKNS